MSKGKHLFARIMDADDADQIAFARHLCERHLANYPDHGPTLVVYARLLISLGQYAPAQSTLDHAQEIVPPERLPLVLALRGDLLKQQGDLAGAEELYLSALELSPDDATDLIYAGSVAFRSGNLERAKEHARKATKCSEGCIEEAWFNLGGYLLSEQQYFEAADCYRRALEIDPDYQLAAQRLRDVELIIADT